MKAIQFLLSLLVFLGISVSVSAKSVDTTGFAKADAHALAAPGRAEKSIAQLGEYLTGPFKTETLKARAIYTWVISNVKYDVNRAFGSRPAGYMTVQESNSKANPQWPDNVLSSRVAVCQGYSNLFKELCKTAGIEAVTVSGYDKGWFYQTNGTLTLSHAWNLVKLEGQWHPVDATWGAGHADENRRFVANPSYEFFLAEPAKFVEKHLPGDPAFQLLPHPVPMQVFKGSPESIAAYLAGDKGSAGNWNDTLTTEASLEPTLREYHSMRRAIAFQPQNSWARLKLAEFHASRAMMAFARYQKALEEAKAAQTPPTSEAISTLDEAETELTTSRGWLNGIPRSEKDLVGFADNNNRLITQNLASIRKQKEFWKKQRL